MTEPDDERLILAELGFLREKMQEDPEISAVVLKTINERGEPDLGRYAWTHWEEFLVLVDGIRDLIAQDPETS